MNTPRPKRRFWQTCRICFRRLRITVWLIVLLLLGALLYLNQVGLPEFAKRPLLETLRARGLDLQFSRLRLRWHEGIVAENVRFGQADQPLSPQFTLRELELAINYKLLARLKLQVDSLTLRQGRLTWPIGQTNGPLRLLSVDNIQTDLRLLPNDQWALNHFTAAFHGARIQLSGLVTNASAVRDWKMFATTPTAPRGALQNRLKQLADTLDLIRFSAAPELKLDVRGDARDLQSFTIHLAMRAPDAATPWGNLVGGHFVTRVFPQGSNQVSHAELRLEANEAHTQWASTTNLQLQIQFAVRENETNLVNGDLILSAAALAAKEGSAKNARFTARWVHSLTNLVPLSGEGHLTCQNAETTLANGATVRELDVRTRLTENASGLQGDQTWAWWTNLAPYSLDWECRLLGLRSPRLEADLIAGGGRWQVPGLTITNLHAELYQGQLDVSSSLDVAERSLHARIHSTVDPHKLSPVLTEGGRKWLANFSWNKPPVVNGDAFLRLPAWTNRHPDWRAEVQPSLRLTGEFRADQGGTYRELPVISASSHFTYSNMSWRLPDLTALRPEGALVAEHHSNDRTKEFYWRIQSSIDPKVLRPLLQTNQQRDLDMVSLSQPPQFKGEVWGRWHDPESVGFSGTVAVTNFIFRGETVDGFQSGLEYSNRFLVLTSAQLQRGLQRLSAERVAVDFPSQKIYLANGFSTAEPQVVARAIGPKIARTLEPYRFGRPPIARVHGTIPIRHEADADLHFDLDGGPFQWSKFSLDHVVAHVHWKGERLSLENVRADCYGGFANGSASFDFAPHHGTAYRFNLVATNALLQLLMADISTRTNHLEGTLSGSLIVNQANSVDWRSWQGGGNADLRDGLIWEFPIFGIFSPILNSVAPGLGNSRATAALGTFVISNGVVRSEDLEIHSPAMRLTYRGTVDLQQQVDARVEAELLRDVWLVGPLFSTVFWPVTKIFEYRLTGSLGQPKSEPVWLIPKLVLMPFHPLRLLKDLVPEDTGPPRTNAPPFQPLP